MTLIIGVGLSFGYWVLASESRHNRSDVSSVRSLLVVEERMRSNGCL